METREKQDVVVVGGGIAGLATGALLAKSGRSVTVLEKGSQPGGRGYSYESEGFTLNYGPHGVYRPFSVVRELMARFGRPPFPQGLPSNSRSYWSMGDQFGAVSEKPHELLMTKLFPIASRPKLIALLLKMKGTNTEKLGDMTFGEWVDGQTRDPGIRAFARAFATVNAYTRPAGDLSARWMLQHIQRSLAGKDYVGYMDGGWKTMYGAFIEELRAGGGSLVTRAHVRGIEQRVERVTAVVTDDARYEADAFVLAMPPDDVLPLVEGSPLAAEFAQWTGRVDVRALCIDLGLGRPVRDDDATFIYDIERDLYFSIHSETAKGLAPEGGQLLHAMAYLSPEEAASESGREGRRQELLAGLDRFFAGWRDVTVVERSIPSGRVAWARWTPDQMEAARVPLQSSVAGNLYFAGDARDIPLNLGEIPLTSAMQVADAIARDFAAEVVRLALATA